MDEFLFCTIVILKLYYSSYSYYVLNKKSKNLKVNLCYTYVTLSHLYIVAHFRRVNQFFLGASLCSNFTIDCDIKDTTIDDFPLFFLWWSLESIGCTLLCAM